MLEGGASDDSFFSFPDVPPPTNRGGPSGAAVKYSVRSAASSPIRVVCECGGSAAGGTGGSAPIRWRRHIGEAEEAVIRGPAVKHSIRCAASSPIRVVCECGGSAAGGAGGSAHICWRQHIGEAEKAVIRGPAVKHCIRCAASSRRRSCLYRIAICLLLCSR